ncbi:MAG: hypothetical protein RLZZ271_686 [Pseudomonadota bacterium]|jgi:hypothetical protein
MSRLFFVTICAVSLLSHGVWAQSRIYRCGNEYTNNPSQDQLRNCKLIEGGNLTVVQSGKSAGPAKTAKPEGKSASPSKAPEPAPEQKARDGDTKAILESELSKAEQKRAELLKEYNNGEPEKQGPEHRNHQKYLDRVSELRSNIDRTESDIASIKRELARLLGR